MPVSEKWQNCTYNETSFFESFDTPEWNLTRWSLNWEGFGYSAGHGFKAINKLTNVPGLGNYTNLERGVPIPGTKIKGARFTSSRKPCIANPEFCNQGNLQSGWSGVYLNSKSCMKYGQWNITMASKNKNSY